MTDPLKVAQATSAIVTFDHTRPKSRIGIPTEHVFTGLTVLAALWMAGMGYGIGRYQGAVTVTRTVHTRQTVSQLLGKPDSVVDGGQVNAQLAGWKCAIYSSKKTLLCRQ